MGYIFISYSTRKQAAADAMRQLLAEHHIKTWMAPYDIPVGEKYAGVINKVIRTCSGVLLMMSDAAQKSAWVEKEIERAINYRKTIMPVMLENVTLNDAFQLYISTDQMVALPVIDRNVPEMKRIIAAARELCEADPAQGEWEELISEETEEVPAVKENGSTCDTQEISFADAAFQIGKCYDTGREVERNVAEAVKWLRMAADRKHPAAMDYLGSHYYHGIGVEKDYDKAVKLYRSAAELEWADAQYNLGLCYNSGKGIERDTGRALYWFRKAAGQGHANAQFQMGHCCAVGKGTEIDVKEAAHWIVLAAEQEHPSALDYLGSYHYHGIGGIRKDYPEAVKNYRRAAELGSAAGQYNLGLCFQSGKGVERDLKQAFDCFYKAALMGHRDAMRALVDYYENGWGGEKNAEKAEYWKKMLQ